MLLIQAISFLAFLLVTLCGRCVFADTSIGTGSVEAPVLVGGITAVSSALAEAKKKPDPKAQTETNNAKDEPSPRTDTTPDRESPPPPPARRAALPSRLEVVAGADRLVAISDVFKQASLSAEARYRLTETLQFGVSAGIRVQGNDFAKDVAAQLLFGPTFNFVGEGGLRNAFFFSPKVGLTAQRETVNDNTVKSGVQPTFSLSLGKRFAISQSVAYAPSIGVVTQAGYSPCFVAVPLALSIFF